MTTLFTPAVKEKLKARVAIDGPTGSGKTYTALQWARILAGDNPVGVIDTENRSAAYYAPAPGTPVDRLNSWEPPYVFGHMPWSPPYEPDRLAATIEAAHGELGDDGVLVIDSLTHFYSGEGGTLDVVDSAGKRSGGNSFAGWKVGTPMQRHLVDTIIRAPFHVVVTMRSKMEWVVEQTERNGRTTSTPRKIGLAPEQRAGIEYEFTVVGDMNLEHELVVTKSRCDLLADVVTQRTHEPALAFRDWLLSGVERIPAGTVEQIAARFNAVGDEAVRTGLKTAFANEFGRPADLLTDQLAGALVWLAERLDRYHDPDPSTLFAADGLPVEPEFDVDPERGAA